METKLLKRYPNLLVPWHTHLYRAGLSLIGRRKKPWYLHVGRAYQSLVWKFSFQRQIGHNRAIEFPGQGQDKLFVFADHTVTLDANTGLQRVVRMLGRALLANGHPVQFVRWSDNYQTLVILDEEERQELSRWNGPAAPAAAVPGGLLPVHQPGQGNWLIVPEVTHITRHSKAVTGQIIASARRLGLRSAFIFYDAIPMRRPEYADSIPRHQEYIRELRRADIVLPISHFSHGDLLKYSGVAAESDSRRWAQPLPLPAESILGPRGSDLAAVTRHDRTILCVGSITLHKNQLALLRAFARHCQSYPANGWRLLLIGNLHGLVADEVQQLAHSNPRVQLMANADDDTLAACYRNCAFTVFPSVEEGYGLPIAESLWFGKPCVCSNFGAMAEVSAPGGCVQVDTRSEAELEQAMTTLITEPARLAALCREALGLRLTTWQDYAAALVALLRKQEGARP